ncbi:cyclopropane fatty acyl phospholipid synthase [Candidatus Woesearchaeota archaeon]|nr:cyclopropane fatty acyl phospholipid synthase [Candidatus Woesearchaeota archaeon]
MKEKIQDILNIAGIKINGNNPYDIKVYNEKLYQRVLSGGSLALGESYMDGWWDCDRLDQFFYRILKSKLNHRVINWKQLIIQFLKSKLTNESKRKKYEIGKKHYDIGNELYKIMLDKRLVYSCAYWKNAKNLDQAQAAKLDLICRKIGLKKGQKILDIGCGWGSFARYAAEKYKVRVVGITVSKEQVKLAKEFCKNFPIEIRLQDYRSLNEKFDHIVSVGMFEHVGYKNYNEYMNIVRKCLKPNGLFLLQTIGKNTSTALTDPWISKYIFPNSMLPSAKKITSACENLLMIEDWHSFGNDYDKTLMAWHKNFVKNWQLIKHDYDNKFYRMWNYYLLSSAGAFRANNIRLWQIVFSRDGLEDGYISIR